MKTISHYIRVLKEQDKPLKYLISRFLWKTQLCRLFTIAGGSFKLRFYPSNVSACYWYDTDIFRNDEIFFERYLKKGDVVIDAGANIGVLTLKAAGIVGNTGKVFSIEPHPRIFEYLKGNVELNRFANVTSLNLAVGDRQGILAFSDEKTADDVNRIVSQGKMQVSVDTLDNLFDDKLKAVDLLKIDVEGYEQFALVGASRILAKTKCVYFESYDENFSKYNSCAGKVIQILSQMGFKVVKIEDGYIHGVAQDHVSPQCENLVAIRDMAEFMQRTGFKL